MTNPFKNPIVWTTTKSIMVSLLSGSLVFSTVKWVVDKNVPYLSEVIIAMGGVSVVVVAIRKILIVIVDIMAQKRVEELTAPPVNTDIDNNTPPVDTPQAQ